MQRYHDTSTDPLPLHSPLHDAARMTLEQQIAEFLARGGQIEQVGFQMSSAPASFVINPERSPVYAHLFQPTASTDTPEALPVEVAEIDITAAATDCPKQRNASLIMAAAALGDSPTWIARKLHMTEKEVRQIGRDYRITFHKQR
jgi:hypothetical protein